MKYMSDSVDKVQELLKLPQHLCKMCGMCCKIATFKGGLSYEEVLELSQSTTEEFSQVDGARNFLSIFKPYPSVEEAKRAAPEFVEMILQKYGRDAKIAFFCCKFISDDNKCLIHEDRPLLCRMYPIPHERTFYNPSCGFKEQGEKNWQEILEIIKNLQEKAKGS